MKEIRYSKLLKIILLGLISLVIAQIAIPYTAKAEDVPEYNTKPEHILENINLVKSSIEKKNYINAISQCMDTLPTTGTGGLLNGRWKMSAENAKSVKWFDESSFPDTGFSEFGPLGGYQANLAFEKAKCNSVTADGLSTLGLNNKIIDVICSSGAEETRDGGDGCKSATSSQDIVIYNYHGSDKYKDKLQSTKFKNYLKNTGDPSISTALFIDETYSPPSQYKYHKPAMDYYFNLNILRNGCIGKDQPIETVDTAHAPYKVLLMSKSGNDYEYYTSGIKMSPDSELSYRSLTGELKSDKCSNINNRVNDAAEELIVGITTYVSVRHPVSGEVSDIISEILEGINTITISDTPTDKTKSKCNIESIGWIICPVINFLANIADKAYGFIEKDFLTLEDSLLNTDTKAAWQSIVGLANIVFIIFFLIIIFSQLTSVGISNYGIKKMLPKLIVAAILVNLSFLICQIAVDISNIVGQSVNEYVKGISPEYKGISTAKLQMPSRTGDGFAGIAGTALVLTAGALFLSLSVLVPMLVGVVISCIMILFILVGRKALVVILAVISPLAFVAYLLPNTKKFFDMWKKAFISILLVYPIVGLVFAGSGLASSVLRANISGEREEGNNMIMEIIASSVAVLPLFVVPGLLKKSLDGVAGLGSMVGKLDKGASGLGKSGVAGIQKKYSESDFGKYRATRKADIKARTKAGNYNGKNLLRKGLSKTYGAANSNRILNAATGGLGANRDKLMKKQDKDDAKEFTEMAGDNEDIINAIANDGFNEDSDAFKGLSKENQKTIRKMKALGLDRKSSTYLGTAQYMAENGMGTGADVDRLLQKAKSNGAKENDVSNAYNASMSNFKKAGRADSLFDLTNRAVAAGVKGVTPMNSMEEAFAKINPTDISKYTLKGDEGYDRVLRSEAENNAMGFYSADQKQTAYKNMLMDQQNRNILTSTINNANNIKNPEAQKLASEVMIKATGKVVANNEKRFADIQAVQNHVKEHGFSEAPPTPPPPTPPPPGTPPTSEPVDYELHSTK